MRLMLDNNDKFIPPRSLRIAIVRASKLAGEIRRLERQLDRWLSHENMNKASVVSDVLARHRLEERQLTAWIDSERDQLIRRARALFQVLQTEDECYFSAEEMRTINDLDAYLATRGRKR